MRCAIWYYWYNLKSVKNTHGGVLILIKLQALACNLLKLTLLHGCFSRFSNGTNGIKSRNAPHIYLMLELLHHKRKFLKTTLVYNSILLKNI